jgi:hypothetical protein
MTDQPTEPAPRRSGPGDESHHPAGPMGRYSKPSPVPETASEPSTSADPMRNIRVADPRERPRWSPSPRAVKHRDPLRDWAATAAVLLLPLLFVLMLTRAGAAAPTMSVSPAAVAPGALLVVHGEGFERGESGTLAWDGRQLDGIAYRATGKGTFDVSMVVPGDATAGPHQIAAVADPKGKTKSLSAAEAVRSVASVEVVIPSDPSPTAPPPTAAPSASPPPSDDPPASPASTPTPAPSAEATPEPQPSAPAPAPTPPPDASPSASPCPASLQALVDAAASGATVSAPACTYRETVRIAKPLTLVTVGGTVDGDGVRTYGFVVAADDVTIDGFEVTRTINPAQDGAIRVRGASRFTLRNATIHDTGGACVSISGGSGHRIVDSELSYCAQEGFHLASLSDTLFARNRIHHNNPKREYNAGWEAGGGKAARVRNVTFEANESWANNGPGLWCDVDCRDVVYRANRVWDNTGAGIFFETGVGATITSNRVWGNGFGHTAWGWGSGILISSSAGAQVTNNVVAWNADGIAVVSQARSDNPGVVNNLVRGNTIVLSPRSTDSSNKFLLAWLQDHSGGIYDEAANNRGADNRYWHSQAEPTGRFEWSGLKSRLSDFNATPGEGDGAYLTVAQRDGALNEAGIPTAP